jgi:photosystem II stability/assembly factor-like uncharacterized protein
MRRISAIAAALVCALTAVLVGQAAASPVSVGRSGWAWSEPSPQGETLNRIAFQGAVGYASGQNGTVLRSEDGGQSWVGLASGTQADLTQLQQIGPSTVLVGGGCTLRESTDGGAGFQQLDINESESGCSHQLASFSFLSASSGYVEQSDGSVLFTGDGGHSLSPRTPVPLNGGTPVQIEFLSGTLGFALVDSSGGARIYRTTDGSGSWTQVATTAAGQSLSELIAVSPTLAYAVGGGPARPGASTSLLLASEDEGVTWKERPLALPAGSPALSLRSISCASAMECVFATEQPGGGASDALMRTADGGMTGTVVTPAQQGLLAASFTTGSHTLAVGEGGTTVLSPDGGVTFPTSISQSLPGGFTGLVRVGGQSPGRAYLAGPAGQILTSADGGSSWQALQVPTSLSLVDVAFPTAEVGYAVNTAGTVYRTGNSGQSWSISPSGGEGPSALVAPSPGTVLLIGPTGVRRSTDGGGSFETVGGTVVVGRRHRRPVRRAVSSLGLFGGAEPAGGAVVAWGDDAYESTDGGARWTLIPRALKNGTVEGVSFLSASTGYEVSRQRLFFTADTGRHWREIGSVGGVVLPGAGQVSFSNVQDGYAIAAWNGGRWLMRTSDGGRTWTPEWLPRRILSVTAAGSEDYANADGGLVRTTDGGLSSAGSSLALTLAGPAKLSTRALRRAHGRVALHGRLAPAQGGEQVVIAYRAAGRSVWQRRTATVSSTGAFAVTISGIAATTTFVAQWSGEGPQAGAGSQAVTLTVGRG